MGTRRDIRDVARGSASLIGNLEQTIPAAVNNVEFIITAAAAAVFVFCALGTIAAIVVITRGPVGVHPPH